MKSFAQQVSYGIGTAIALLAIFGSIFFILIRPKVSSRDPEVKIAAAKADMATFDGLLKQFRLDCGRYPTTAEGLAALTKQPKGLNLTWKGPYPDRDIPNGPWGEPYTYAAKPNGYQIVSMGDDRGPIVDNG